MAISGSRPALVQPEGSAAITPAVAAAVNGDRVSRCFRASSSTSNRR